MNTICKICESASAKIFDKKILGKYQVDYFQCSVCDFIQTEEPYWLNEAYKESINTSDTGLLSRNIYLSKIAILLLFFHFNKSGTFLDFAGGYGVFTRLMRDAGFDFLWHDPFTEDLFAKGFEWSNDRSKKIELLTTFESFEHFTSPKEELEKMLAVSDNIIFSTELIPKTDVSTWWYLGTHHGQHISFYSRKTLNVLADKYNLYLYTNNTNIHLFTKSKKKIRIKIIQLLNKFKLNEFVQKSMVSKTSADNQTVRYLDQIK